MKLAAIIPKKVKLQKGVVIIDNDIPFIIYNVIMDSDLLHCMYIKEGKIVDTCIVVKHVTDVDRVIGTFSEYKKSILETL